MNIFFKIMKWSIGVIVTFICFNFSMIAISSTDDLGVFVGFGGLIVLIAVWLSIAYHKLWSVR